MSSTASLLIDRSSLDILGWLIDSDLDLLGPAIECLALEDVEVDGEGDGDDETDERDEERLLGVSIEGVCDSAKNWREECSSGNSGDDERGTAFAVSSETTEGESEDQGKDARLEEQYQEDGCDTTVALQADDETSEDDDTGQETHEDETRLDEFEHTTGDETTDSEAALSTSKEVCTSGVTGTRSDPGHVIDKVTSICDLSSHITKLCHHAEEKCVLLAEGLVLEVGILGGEGGLLSHIGIGNFREVDEEKDDGEEEDENGDAEVYPLDRRQRFIIDILEDDLGCEDGRNDCSYCLEGLCQSETKLGVFGRTAGGDERIGCCLECGKSATDDEHAQAESNEANWVSKALQVYERW